MADQVFTIRAGRTERQYWQDLWRYRGLFYFLSWRDILVRYKQTVIGLSWALIRPLVTMVVLTFVFGLLAGFPSKGAPYLILVGAGMLPWQFFASALGECSNSLVTNSTLVSKVYFPRLIVPTSSVIVSFVDFLVSAAILAGLMVFFQYPLTWRILLLPLFVGVTFAAAVGAGLWFAALNVRYRDFRHIVPFVVQIGFFISPIGFDRGIIDEKLGPPWTFLYALNPMVGVIDGFRWAILGGDFYIYWPGFMISVALVVLLLLGGIRHFRKTERTFADLI
jgi:lipopolysaccharide transport system permease protein